MQAALRHIERELLEARDLSARLSPLHRELARPMKAALAGSFRTGDLFIAEEDRARRELAESALGRPESREALRFAIERGYGLTNWGAVTFSRFEPPQRPWRPFVANAHTPRRRGQALSRLQSLLFERAFEAEAGTHVFPAMGLDSEDLRPGRYVSVAPHRTPPRAPARVRLAHVPKRVEELAEADLRAAEERLLAQPAEPRVLVLKGAQSLFAPVELDAFIERISPATILAFGTAASGFTRTPVALPLLTSHLREQIERHHFEDVTGAVFSRDELAALARIHDLLEAGFAWQAGHFPASQVRVYRRRWSAG